VGGLLPGLSWTQGGWPATSAQVVSMLAVMAGIASLAYRGATE
jgi:hypothetical protein